MTPFRDRLSFIAVLTAAGLMLQNSQAEEIETPPPDAWKLRLDMTYATKYMANGFNVADDEPSFQPAVHLDSPIPGLGLTYWGALPTERQVNDSDEHDIMIRYSRTYFEKELWAFNLYHYIDYWLYPNLHYRRNSRTPPLKEETFEGMKLMSGINFPKLLPVGNSCLVPSYTVYHWMPLEEDLFENGTVHELGVSYALPLDRAQKFALRLTETINYNDGVFGVASGWSHATSGIALPVPLGPRLKLTPAVNYQWSLEDTVDPENEFWSSITAAWSF